MRRIFKRLLYILDGTPAEYAPPQERERGQSLAEMTLVVPLLMILIVGIVEIGWFANNYLILLEVSRVGARRGAVLTGELGPLEYNDMASLAYTQDPEIYDPYWGDYNNYTDGDVDSLRRFGRLCGSDGDNTIITKQQEFGFYYQMLCIMQQSMLPLEIRDNLTAEDIQNGAERTDDIVISVFQVAMINNNPEVDQGEYDFDANGIDGYERGPVPVVVGRYPSNANECNVIRDNLGDRYVAIETELNQNDQIERDPFDWNRNNSATTAGEDFLVLSPPPGAPPGAADRFNYLELGNGIFSELDTGTDLLRFDRDNVPEMQRGWSYTGYHQLDGSYSGQVVIPFSGAASNREGQLFCFGSEWTIAEIEELMLAERFELTPDEAAADPDLVNTYCTDPQPNPAFDPTDENETDPEFICPPGALAIDNVRRFYPDQGMVLVEIFWQHDLLLDLPGFSPVFNIVGGDSTVINVWSAFPVPAANPSIDFDLEWADLND